MMNFFKGLIRGKSYIAITALIFITLSSTGNAQADSAEILKLKANFVNIFMKYIQNKSANTICVAGNSELYNTLKSSAKSSVVALGGTDASNCSLVFVGKDAAGAATIIKSADSKGTVTISDKGSFLNQGGLVELYEKEGKIKFGLNMKKAAAVKVKFDSKLVELADKTI